MKTTCTVLMIGENGIFRGHVGDSRIYYFRNGKMEDRTLDHSVPQLLAQAGRIREKDIRHHPDRNRLLRVMGIEWDEPRFELADTLEKGKRQAFLLCSDGFWELVDEKKMMACLKKADSPETWLRQMEQIVLKNGDLACVADDPVGAMIYAFGLVEGMEDRETCVIFCGKERDEELNEKLEEELSYRYPMTDFSFIDGGQEIYRWIAGIG